MSLICPMENCKQKQGMCIHDKMLVAIVAVVVIAGGALLLQ